MPSYLASPCVSTCEGFYSVPMPTAVSKFPFIATAILESIDSEASIVIAGCWEVRRGMKIPVEPESRSGLPTLPSTSTDGRSTASQRDAKIRVPSYRRTNMDCLGGFR